MKIEQVVRRALLDELEKIGVDLTEAARAQIAKKHFALTPSQSTTGKPAYPMHDLEHARSALRLVGMHGTDVQKAEVRKDAHRKYPELGKPKTAAPGGVGRFLTKFDKPLDVAGLGILGAGPIDTLQAKARARMAGDKTPEGAKSRRLLGDSTRAGLEVGGLGVLAAEPLSHVLRRH